MSVHLQKYPVMSPRGNTYLVDVFKTRWSYAGRDIAVNICESYKGFLGKRKFRVINDSTIYSEESYDYDYVAIAKAEIERYESLIEARKQAEVKRNQGEKQFEEWDGDA
jgi:hypothetical protein